MQAQHTASASAKLPFLFVEVEFLRNRQSGAVPGFGTAGGKIENTFSVGPEHREHGVSRLLLLLFLRMAVIADKTSDNAADRVFRVRFNLKAGAYDKKKVYRLVIANDIDVEEIEFHIDIALADDFGFDL